MVCGGALEQAGQQLPLVKEVLAGRALEARHVLELQPRRRRKARVAELVAAPDLGLSRRVHARLEPRVLDLAREGLLAAPLAFSYAAPVFEILLSILVIIGVPLNATRMLSARLILEQTSLYLLLGKLVSMRHPSFFSKKWIRIKWKAPWLLPTLGGYTASLALFNLVEPKVILIQNGLSTFEIVTHFTALEPRDTHHPI